MRSIPTRRASEGRRKSLSWDGKPLAGASGWYTMIGSGGAFLTVNPRITDLGRSRTDYGPGSVSAIETTATHEPDDRLTHRGYA
jgi:hypothetical protein